MQIQSINSTDNKSFKARFLKNGNFMKIWEQQDWTKDLDESAKKFSKYKKNHVLEVIQTFCNQKGEINKYTVFNHNTGMTANITTDGSFSKSNILVDFFNKVIKGNVWYLFDERNAKQEAFDLITKK